jgi:hypothetical protein
MSDTEYSEYERDVGLDAEDKARVHADRQEWFKMTKGQVQLASFLYFHPVDVTAVNGMRREAKKQSRVVTPEEIKAAACAAIEAKAASCTPPKAVDQLTSDEKLDLTVAQFKSFKAHYQEGLGFLLSRMGKDGAEADAVWKKLPEPRQHFATLLLLYPTGRDGKHDVEAIKAGAWRVMPWRFGKTTYHDIWSLNDGLRENSMSIANQDIRLECKETQFQKVDVSFVGKAMWQASPGFRTTVLKTAMAMYDQLVPFRELTTEALKQKVAFAGGSLRVPPTEDAATLLDSV